MVIGHGDYHWQHEPCWYAVRKTGNGTGDRKQTTVCPPELSDAARREWSRLVGELSKLNLLTHLDRPALAAYCNAYAMWVEDIEAIQKYGSMVKSPNGYLVQSPYVAIANRQAEIMLRISAEFGFTPASCGRIAAPPKEQGELFDCGADSNADA